jgi:photosystem II stability/assembly factor-like uncharacterized protein
MKKWSLCVLTIGLFLSVANGADVTNVTLTAVSSTTLSVTWVISSASSPTIVLSTDNFGTFVSSVTGPANQQTTSYANLSPNTTYYFQVKNSAETDINYVGFNVLKATITHAAVPVVDAFSGVTPLVMVPHWLSNGNPASTSYTAQISTTPSFVLVFASSTTTDTSVRFNGLTAGVVYYFRVRATNHNGVLTVFSDLGSQATPSQPGSNAYVVSGNDLKVAAVTGGNVRNFAFDPRNTSTVYAGVSGAGLYKSIDRGTTWKQILLPTVGSHDANHVLASSHTANVVLVCEGNGTPLWRSADGGTSWSEGLSDRSGRCTSLGEGSSAGVFYAGIETNFTGNNFTSVARVYRSADNGVTWSALSFSSAGVKVSDIRQLPSGRLLVATQAYPNSSSGGRAVSGGIFYSDDTGSTWSQSSGSSQAVINLAYNGVDTLMAFKADASNVMVSSSTDGSSWAAPMGTYADAVCSTCDLWSRTFQYHPASNTFFALAGNLYQSSSGDSGYAWPGSSTRINAMKEGSYSLALGAPNNFVVDPANANTILCSATGDGIFKTVDGGIHWEINNTGLYAADIAQAYKSPSTGYIYAMGSQGFVYFSAGNLERWTRIYRPADTIAAQSMAVDASDPKRFLVSLSTDSNNFGGQLLLHNDLTSAVEDVAPFPHTGWQKLSHPTPTFPEQVYAVLLDGPTLYAGLTPSNNAASGQYLYKSTNSGTSWQALSLTVKGGIRSLAFDPINRNILYAGAGDINLNPRASSNAGGMFKSIDGGLTWTPLNSHGTLNNQAPRKIIVDPGNPSRVWVLAHPTGGTSASLADVYESESGGTTWTRITPSNNAGFGLSDLSYNAASGLLLMAIQMSGTNVFWQSPGACSGPCQWKEAFGVYGAAQTLYSGSVGVGSSGGLFEAAVFQPAPSVPGNGFSNVHIYPNPFRPAKGHATMDIINLPANARVSVYTFSGELLGELLADVTGRARWSVTNQSGDRVASGVYFALGESGGQRKVFKLAVQR